MKKRLATQSERTCRPHCCNQAFTLRTPAVSLIRIFQQQRRETAPVSHCKNKKSLAAFCEHRQDYGSQKRRPEHPTQDLPQSRWRSHPVGISTSVQPCEQERQTR